jgi:hypothetical protein
MVVRLDADFAAGVMRAAGLEPLTTYPGSKVKWLCRCLTCGEEVSPLYSTVSRGIGGCEVCARRVTARLQREKGLLRARETLSGAGFELLGNYSNARTFSLIRCLSCGQVAKRTLNDIKQGQRCQCQRKPRKPLVSFRPDLASELHPTLNGNRDGLTIGTGERNNVWWLCLQGHEYEATPANRVHEKTESCPYCTRRIAISGVTDFVTENPTLAEELAALQPEGVEPAKLRSHSNVKFRWRCVVYQDHFWESAPSDRLRGFGCPICNGKKVLQGFNDLASTQPEVADQWHPTRNGHLKPTEVATRSNKIVWWLCDQGHEWKANISPRALGVGCPRCSKAGFDSTLPGIFYFIEQPEFLAMKVGITNKNARKDRLAKFRSAGWQIISTIERDDGRKVLELETAMLRWIRKDLGLQVFLGMEEMSTTGGHSETFASDGVEVLTVLDKMNFIMSQIDEAGI